MYIHSRQHTIDTRTLARTRTQPPRDPHPLTRSVEAPLLWVRRCETVSDGVPSTPSCTPLGRSRVLRHRRVSWPYELHRHRLARVLHKGQGGLLHVRALAVDDDRVDLLLELLEEGLDERLRSKR